MRKVNNSREAQNVEWAGKLSEGNINDLMFNLKNCGFKTFLELNLLPPFATLWVMKHGLKVPTECSASAAMMDQLSDGLIFWIFTSTWTRRKVKPQYSNHFIMMETSKQHSILGLVLK